MANTIVTFESCECAKIVALRQEYLAGLREPQEPLLETLVPDALATQVVRKGSVIGYALTHPDKGMFEYYLTPEHWVFSVEVFGRLIRTVDVRCALVKSFDDLFLAAAIDHHTAIVSIGVLVRDYVPRPLPELARISYTQRLAEAEDISRLQRVEQTVFAHAGRLREAVAQGQVWLFEQGKTLLGFGLIKPVPSVSAPGLSAGRPAVDIGIAVDRPFRNKGYAVYIMRDLVNRSLEMGYRPIAGCARDNLPSLRMGERIGLAHRHRLLRVTF